MPIPVAGLTCDGDTSKCTASLVREFHSLAYSLLKSEISEVGRRALDRPVEHQGLPLGSVRPRVRRELSGSPLTKMAMSWQETPLGRDGPRACQNANLRRWIFQVHCELGEQPSSAWWFVSSIDIDNVYHAGLWWWVLGSRVGRLILPLLERHLSPITQERERNRHPQPSWGDILVCECTRSFSWKCDSWLSIAWTLYQ